MYLFGASGHGKVIAEIAKLNQIPLEGIIDQNPDLKEFLDFPVLQHPPTDAIDIIISIGNNAIRKLIVTENTQFRYPTLIHPNAIVSDSATIGNGTVILAGAVVNAAVKIGQHCIINTCSSIDHDCIIDDFAHISPQVSLAGSVSVGEGSQVGIGACVIPGIRIGKWAMVGAGTVVIHDVPDYAVVVGNPGKIIKFNKAIDQ